MDYNRKLLLLINRYMSPSLFLGLFRYVRFRVLLTRVKRSSGPINVVIGASGKGNIGWLSTERLWLDITKSDDWSKFFEHNQIHRILAEHVLEHLTPLELEGAIRNFHLFLRPGGSVRAAVPDGNHVSDAYIQRVKPGGYGAGSDDHKVLYTFAVLRDIFLSHGFTVTGLEYFDDSGYFHHSTWNVEDGYIRRSLAHDERNEPGTNNYSSIILDARKPG